MVLMVASIIKKPLKTAFRAVRRAFLVLSEHKKRSLWGSLICVPFDLLEWV
jgi:hypothetical protein